jgi:hypothetical protein
MSRRCASSERLWRPYQSSEANQWLRALPVFTCMLSVTSELTWVFSFYSFWYAVYLSHSIWSFHSNCSNISCSAFLSYQYGRINDISEIASSCLNNVWSRQCQKCDKTYSIMGRSPDWIDTKILVEYLHKIVRNFSWTGNFLNSNAHDKWFQKIYRVHSTTNALFIRLEKALKFSLKYTQISLLHVSVYDHHQVAYAGAWLKLYLC